VALDASTIDIVFSDSDGMHGGFFDDNSGLNYHISVRNDRDNVKKLKVVHLSVEMAPIAKVGGMGDVVTALARAVQAEGHQVSVILPKYDVLPDSELIDLSKTSIAFQRNGCHIEVFSALVENVQVILLEPDNGYFRVGCIYGRNDDADRFHFFCDIAMEYLAISDENPDIIHCHDWPTAPGVFLGDTGEKVFTIHNLNYGADAIQQAMHACAIATTVSPTYALEICGHPAIAPNNRKLHGIINGIDTDTWSPYRDPFLPVQYSSTNVVAGKSAARRELRSRFGLSQTDVPVVGVVTRLTHQKGIHLIKHAAWRCLERGGQFVLLGSAPDPQVQSEFNDLSSELSRHYPDRAKLWFAFDEPLSHLIYAGSDIILVPSMFEPCGLTQLIAMSYGTIPVVRRTGGLNDTVFDVDYDGQRAEEVGCEPNGFSFEGANTHSLDLALNRALNLWYNDKGAWSLLARTVMNQDWTWNSPALDYIDIYYRAMKG